MRNNPDTRDLLFQETEKQAASYNRLRSYQPTSQDLARAGQYHQRRGQSKCIQQRYSPIAWE